MYIHTKGITQLVNKTMDRKRPVQMQHKIMLSSGWFSNEQSFVTYSHLETYWESGKNKSTGYHHKHGTICKIY